MQNKEARKPTQEQMPPKLWESNSSSSPEFLLELGRRYALALRDRLIAELEEARYEDKFSHAVSL